MPGIVLQGPKVAWLFTQRRSQSCPTKELLVGPSTTPTSTKGSGTKSLTTVWPSLTWVVRGTTTSAIPHC
eukprot:2494012-Prorocentrum_lima.AAC.1